jgi:hypothetical protein
MPVSYDGHHHHPALIPTRLLSQEAPLSLLPTNPSRLTVDGSSARLEIQRQVQGDLGQLILAIGLVTLFVGTLGIGGTTLARIVQ